MELSRRDAVAALGALGAGTATAGCLQGSPDGDGDDGGEEAAVRETLVAAAEVLYPSAVDGIDEFVGTFLAGRLDDGPHAAGVRDAVDALETRAEAWYDGNVAALSAEDRDSLLRETGAGAADPDPDGTPAERIRYYIVNELLLALYSSPTGGELVGIENPQGHAGGLDSYQRGPTA
ncbi:gluconate 2-dehydrogenase subunit 3 family protein [Halohasta salina]|uniref:gluconate 2-dehydrogenase subunit 3 family protein n=1 Tax=Halohasta salina TaxID=2961621 RepID=UPI0020A35488|nr:gluconate 2-dehydrogenase subunit 3 family protein [Halohasta salina]